MTPAIRMLEARNIPHTIHEYSHHAGAESFGMEAAEALGVDPRRMFKTLVALVDGRTLAFGIIPVSQRLSLKLLAAALNGKRAEMADPAAAERATGYVVGGISPIGGRKRLPAAMDESALLHETIYISAGRRGMQIEVAPQDLARLIAAVTAPLLAE